MLKKEKISKKSLRILAKERSQDQRDDFVLKVSQYHHTQLIYIDESASNKHTVHRKKGWSLFGIKPTFSRPLKRQERYSILPAYYSDGILCYIIHHGSIKGYRFEWFLEEVVLPRCNPFPRPKSVIIIDNCSIHMNARIEELYNKYGVKVLYLPPYSPDYNPIKEFFSVLKAWLKRHHKDLTIVNFKDYLTFTVEAYSNNNTAEAHFSHAGYLKKDRTGEVMADDISEWEI